MAVTAQAAPSRDQPDALGFWLESTRARVTRIAEALADGDVDFAFELAEELEADLADTRAALVSSHAHERRQPNVDCLRPRQRAGARTVDWFIKSRTPGMAVCFKCGGDFLPEEGYRPLAGCHGICIGCARGLA